MLKMDAYINTKSKGYSMGMKQKLGIAIALLNKPQLVILDEPMNGLDIEATILIRKIIKQYAAQGSAFLISSHVLGELQKVMTNVLLITEGKIIVDEPIDEFNRGSRQQYHLLTEDMPETEKLFVENQIPVTKSDDYLVISRELSDQVQDLLYSHHIRLVELSPQGLSFEQTVVSLLQQQRRQSMKTSLKQEFYKFRHQRIPLYGAIALVILMLYAAVSSSDVNRMIIAQGFGAGQWITIIMITIASTFVAMEYENRTIMTLFYKSSNKSAIYFAKFIVMVVYGVLMLIFGMLLTFILKAVMVGGKYQWGAMYGQHSLVTDLVLNTAGTFIYLLFIITVAFLLITLIRVNAAVVGIGLVIIFMGADFSSLIMSALPHLAAIIKWNPLNMVFVINQLANSSYEKFSDLSLLQIITGNLIYAVIFIVIGDLLFKSRRV